MNRPAPSTAAAGPCLSGSVVTRRSFVKRSVACVGAGFGLQAMERLVNAASNPASPTTSDPAYHFLNRISYSVLPANYARVQKVGIPAYLNEQLSRRVVIASDLVPVPGILRLSRRAIYSAYRKDPYEPSRRALLYGMIRRATLSPAQLYERMTEFWSDHFNIESQDLEPEVADWQRTVIRPHALGNFRTLLQATGRHVAMLYYLNNAESTADHPNENYARELMELHTLGVGSGYTETDVKEVARAFTGWTADYQPYSGFLFDPAIHDPGAKIILGRQIAARNGAAGVQDGIDVLNLLAADPRTAHFICRKLCVRFVSDSPPESLVSQMAQAWQNSAGEIIPVLKVLFLSAEFEASAGAKLRRPLDFLISGLRATGTTYTDFYVLDDQLTQLDQPPYGWHAPNGYPDSALAWANTSGLVARWNVGQALTAGALPAARSSMLSSFQRHLRGANTVGALVDLLAQNFFAAQVAVETRAALVAYAADGGSDSTAVTPVLLNAKLGVLAGLLLAAPEFQWR